ncbi:hypothetical protein QR680_005939 [Steinernema hermaphroditum]|uniref:Arb2 domain-containing protein n=1 Tax=Steinernema hermaphroditum TaxID=289476 RepID=A0AA39LWJ6_9BILA|nr:hypothetical protein QR680_005939 [Steinernema hermaphroditum]
MNYEFKKAPIVNGKTYQMTEHNTSASKLSQHEEERLRLTNDLCNLGYVINEEGALASVEDGSKFKYTNEDNYDQVGSLLLDLMYNELTDPNGEYKFEHLRVEDSTAGYFASSDYRTAETVVVLVHGSGKVRAGQWARSLMINEPMDNGSMMPMIRHFQQKGYGVVLFDYNEKIETEWKPLKISRDTWFHLTKDGYLRASSIVIICHSFGGEVTFDMLEACVSDEDDPREPPVKAVVFTDVGISCKRTIKLVEDWEKPPKCRHWMVSSRDLDERIAENIDYVVSAGTTEHIRTTLRATESIYKFVEEELRK